MTADPLTYLRGKTGTLTINSVDFGNCRVVDYERDGEAMEHIDATDGEGAIDKVLNTGMKATIAATTDQFKPTVMKMIFGTGSGTGGTFPVGFNTNEYTISWVFSLEDGDETYSTLTFSHDKCIIRPATGLNMTQGDWAGIPFELSILKSGTGTYKYGKWAFN